MTSLLEIKNLSVEFASAAGPVYALNSISFSIEKGKTVCLVGESGCGKSVTASAIMQLIQTASGKITSGSLLFDGIDLLTLSPENVSSIRGRQIAMIFQDPMSSLNPVFTCGFQIAEMLRFHTKASKKSAYETTIELLKKVQIPDPEKRYHEFPHQLSGGMRQRIMIAMALSCNPKLLIADEPTTALDVTIQAQILDLFHDLKKTADMSILFITHDLGIVANIADDVIVLYAGTVVEVASAKELFENAKHPYTRGLLKALPKVHDQSGKLYTIAGVLPNSTLKPSGCRFYDRCERHSNKCQQKPPEIMISNRHMVACFHPIT